jgi:hypothetical protein
MAIDLHRTLARQKRAESIAMRGLAACLSCSILAFTLPEAFEPWLVLVSFCGLMATLYAIVVLRPKN